MSVMSTLRRLCGRIAEMMTTGADRDEELEALVRSQRRDDRQRVDLQRFRNAAGEQEETLALDALPSQELTEDVEEYDGMAYEEPGFARVEDELSQDEPATPLYASEARAAVVRTVVASLSAFERRVYELAFGPAMMSVREIAHEMDDAVSKDTVHRAIASVKEKVAAALAAAGLGGQTGDDHAQPR